MFQVKESETLAEAIDRLLEEREKSGWKFWPYAEYSEVGDTLRAFIADERYYAKDLPGPTIRESDGVRLNSLGVYLSMENDAVIGLSVYGLTEVLKRVGLRIVPIEPEPTSVISDGVNIVPIAGTLINVNPAVIDAETA